MPIFERFMPGTSWVLGVGFADYPPGEKVTVVNAPYEGEGDTVWVDVAFADEIVSAVPLEALA